jgi:cold shock CspA family protein
MAPPALGSVASFDELRGLGTVLLDDGRLLSFHATALADRSRQIDPGRRVAVVVVPGHGGRYEAEAVTVL